MPENKSHLAIYHPMKYRLLYFIISLIFIIPGVYSLIRFGLNPAIDFTGGSTIVWQLGDDANEDTLRQIFQDKGVEIKSISREDSNWTIAADPMEKEQYDAVLATTSTSAQLKEISFETVGPTLGGELIRKTIYGILIASGFILLYVAYRFRNLKFGVTAILAMLHDSLIVVGVFSLLGYILGVEVDTLFVTAVLTILSFSVHDTIVVYDRIRELQKKHADLDFEEIVNRAVVETLGRSINNSMTIIFMLLALWLMGGESTKWFIFALLIGTISGTYSSTFTAAPLLVAWHKLSQRRK